MLYFSINLDIYLHIIRYIFNKIVNLTKILFKSNLYNTIVQVGFFDSEMLYKLQVVQTILYKLQLVQTACTSCNLYRHFVQVATCTKSQVIHNIYIYMHTIGNELLNRLTNYKKQQLRVDLQNWENVTTYAKYNVLMSTQRPIIIVSLCLDTLDPQVIKPIQLFHLTVLN